MNQDYVVQELLGMISTQQQQGRVFPELSNDRILAIADSFLFEWNDLGCFDPGVQGEHKIKRGFCPIETYSAHWIKDERFREAIDDFLVREQAHVKNYNDDRKKLLPFKKEITTKIYGS